MTSGTSVKDKRGQAILYQLDKCKCEGNNTNESTRDI